MSLRFCVTIEKRLFFADISAAAAAAAADEYGDELPSGCCCSILTVRMTIMPGSMAKLAVELKLNLEGGGGDDVAAADVVFDSRRCRL